MIFVPQQMSLTSPEMSASMLAQPSAPRGGCASAKMADSGFSYSTCRANRSRNKTQSEKLREKITKGRCVTHRPYTRRASAADPLSSHRRAPEEKRSLFLSVFPYVCPEPVLVKYSFLYIKSSKRPFSIVAYVELRAEPKRGTQLLAIIHHMEATHPGIT